jgi:hypothetical protein
MENQEQIFHPFHRHWKSLCDSHIPTAPTREEKWKAQSRLATLPLLNPLSFELKKEPLKIPIYWNDNYSFGNISS